MSVVINEHHLQRVSPKMTITLNDSLRRVQTANHANTGEFLKSDFESGKILSKKILLQTLGISILHPACVLEAEIPPSTSQQDKNANYQPNFPQPNFPEAPTWAAPVVESEHGDALGLPFHQVVPQVVPDAAPQQGRQPDTGEGGGQPVLVDVTQHLVIQGQHVPQLCLG